MQVLVVEVVEQDHFLLKDAHVLGVALVLQNVFDRVLGESEQVSVELVAYDDDLVVQRVAPGKVCVLYCNL